MNSSSPGPLPARVTNSPHLRMRLIVANLVAVLAMGSALVLPGRAATSEAPPPTQRPAVAADAAPRTSFVASGPKIAAESAAAPVAALVTQPEIPAAELAPPAALLVPEPPASPEPSVKPAPKPKPKPKAKPEAKPVSKPKSKPASQPKATPKPQSKPKPSPSPAPTTYEGTSKLWYPALGIKAAWRWYGCEHGGDPSGLGRGVYRWGCAPKSNIYMMSHAWSTFKAIKNGYHSGKMKVGQSVWYADRKGKVSKWKVKWIKRVKLGYFNATFSDWASNASSNQIMTFQTCDGANDQYRIIVRLVPAG